MEAVGAMAEEADLVVQAFEPAVGEAVLDRGDDALAVLAERAAELDEGREPGSRRPGEPGAEPLLGLGRRPVVEIAERLLEQVGAVSFSVSSSPTAIAA